MGYSVESDRDNVVGIVCSKSRSNRLPHKNMLPITCPQGDGMSLTEKAIRTLEESGIKNILLISDIDSLSGSKYFIRRPESVTKDDTPLRDTVLWGLSQYKKEYDYIVILMPNCPGISNFDIINAINILVENKNDMIVRSYNHITGAENGLVVVRRNYYLSRPIDVYCRAILANGNEIHDKSDYFTEVVKPWEKF